MAIREIYPLMITLALQISLDLNNIVALDGNFDLIQGSLSWAGYCCAALCWIKLCAVAWALN
jgi:hypothetical protein